MKHELKLDVIYFQSVADGEKTFEIRKNDRDFAVGDILYLRECNTITNEYTGRFCYAQVDYILFNCPAIKKGYVIMSITVLKNLEISKICYKINNIFKRKKHAHL